MLLDVDDLVFGKIDVIWVSFIVVLFDSMSFVVLFVCLIMFCIVVVVSVVVVCGVLVLLVYDVLIVYVLFGSVLLVVLVGV